MGSLSYHFDVYEGTESVLAARGHVRRVYYHVHVCEGTHGGHRVCEGARGALVVSRGRMRWGGHMEDTRAWDLAHISELDKRKYDE